MRHVLPLYHVYHVSGTRADAVVFFSRRCAGESPPTRCSKFPLSGLVEVEKDVYTQWFARWLREAAPVLRREPVAPAPPAAAAQPRPAGPTAQETPALDSGGDALAAVAPAASAEHLKSKEDADSRAAAELVAELSTSARADPSSAGGAGNGKGPAGTRPTKPPADMEKEAALLDQL